MISITDYLLARARIEEAQEATRWLLGSLNSRTWEDVGPLAISLAVLLPAIPAAARPLRALELGDDAAHALGLDVERARLALVGAGRRARLGDDGGRRADRLRRAHRAADRAPAHAHRRAAARCSALTGAALVLAADIAAQRLVPGTALPVGVMTGAVRRALPRLAADAGMEGRTRMSAELAAARRRGDARLRRARRRARAVASPIPAGRLHRHRRAQRLRQVDAAAGARADAQAAGRARCCWTARRSRSLPTKQVARRLGLLPQTSIAPDGITVVDLVARGRHPHQRLLRQWSRDDERAVREAMAADARRRARRPARGRALRRPAPARVDRDGARPGDAAAAAGRADDVPRHRPPDRGPRPVRGAARARAARSSPCCTT